MADTIEKVYCTGDGGNDNLAAALLARGRDNDPATMLAAMNGGMGGGWNNPFAYMMMLGMFRFMYGDGWNGQNGNVQRAEIQSQIDSLRTQMSDNHNSDLLMGAIQGNNQDLKTLAANLNCDFNALQSSVCGIQAAIQDVGGKVGFSAERVINAANLGNLNIIQQLKDCCCTTQQNINRMGYENQLGQKDIINAMQQGFCYTNTGLERGFSNLGNLIQSVVCDLKTSGKENTQRIVDVLNNHWEQDLRIQLEDSKRREQTGFIIQQLKTTTTTTGA
ncbi:hypothetical protein [Segatella copri]|jgi:hypothetical protein|uniref:Uncharacterized protein n=1 Tax=Segatella copri TaxID=165179 RepID=A0AA93BKQ3_9BACT|nr:hypothetical protein [Segatella copri]RHA82554.1 hypothetical protein DW916_14935 [Segatella copri]UWF88061.1 MAG: hypothetical protein [Bacteriophage sp.]DAV83866.1 MAG TPA: hypothetical protein [Caudoviricetes sp.]